MNAKKGSPSHQSQVFENILKIMSMESGPFDGFRTRFIEFDMSP